MVQGVNGGHRLQGREDELQIDGIERRSSKCRVGRSFSNAFMVHNLPHLRGDGGSSAVTHRSVAMRNLKQQDSKL